MGMWTFICMFLPGNILNPLKIFGTRNMPEGSQTSLQQKPSTAPDGSLIINVPEKFGETTRGEIQEGHGIIDVGVQYPPPPVLTGNDYTDQEKNIPEVSQPLIAKERSQSSHSLEILKSIVYGGLVELVTSLSIVSSAAASHATTLNTVILALANLLGGVFVLLHNVKELKYEDSEEAEELKESRYLKTLGRKENFIVHIIFVVLSYVVFGLVPPAVYGFTFRETDDQDLKLVAVAGASVLCVFILSIAKVFTDRQQSFMGYLKTVVYYVVGAVAASGIAYASGHLLERFINDLSWFDPKKPVEQLLIPGNKNWVSF